MKAVEVKNQATAAAVTASSVKAGLAIALAGESTTLTLWLEKNKIAFEKDIVCALTWHVTWQKEENSLKDLQASSTSFNANDFESEVCN